MLTELINKLGTLTYDAVRDVRDVLLWHIHNRAMGVAPSKEARKLAQTHRNRVTLRARGRYPGGWQTITRQPHVTAITDHLEALDTPQLTALHAAAKVLTNALRPRAAIKTTDKGDTLAKGVWQIKTKEVPAKDERGEHIPIMSNDNTPERDEAGNIKYEQKQLYYLYLRITTVTPDGKHRLASVYIGSLNKSVPDVFVERCLAGQALENNKPAIHPDPITRADIIKRFQEGGYEAVKEWRDAVNA